MDKNTVIGFVLIFGLLITWQIFMAPNQKELAMKEQSRLDSLRQLEQKRIDSLAQFQNVVNGNNKQESIDSQTIAQQKTRLSEEFGPFASAASGTERFEKLENDVMRVLFSSKGGRVVEVELKKYFKVKFDSAHKEIKFPLKLMEDAKDKFEYLIPLANVPQGAVSSGDLFFESSKVGEYSIVFKASAGEGRFFEQVYTIEPGSYALQYKVRLTNLQNILSREATTIKLNWINYLDKLEQNHQYERNYSTVYFKPADDGYDYCSCTANDKEDLGIQKVKWVAHSNQFFANVLISKDAPFSGAIMETETFQPENDDLKKVASSLSLPFSEKPEFDMLLYMGPKDFEILSSYGNELQDIIPFGSSIIGTANRWIIRPLFNFLSSFIGIKGIVILVLTLIVKLLLYPLTYKMLYSQSKMAALKPQLTGLREKFKDDQSQLQMETMKVYREFGVNPLGGCLPVVLQMPIWFALYRFFPASIEFRQVDFLWATDLSSYDAAFWLPVSLPFYGQHVSLFTLLWVITTLLYTHYNMKMMDMGSMGGANATMMKWMQYLMPVFFLFFFNNFASGLTVYLVFSNILNVAQTILTKNVIIDQDKILAELEANRKKPKKKGGFQARLEEAMKQQQALAAQREAATKTKKKK
jgi:YidC/Oxa1 family membrane protein insertase